MVSNENCKGRFVGNPDITPFSGSVRIAGDSTGTIPIPRKTSNLSPASFEFQDCANCRCGDADHSRDFDEHSWCAGAHRFLIAELSEFTAGSAVKSRLCITRIYHCPSFFAITKFNKPRRSGRGFPWASIAPVISQWTSTAATSGRTNLDLMVVYVW